MMFIACASGQGWMVGACTQGCDVGNACHRGLEIILGECTAVCFPCVWQV